MSSSNVLTPLRISGSGLHKDDSALTSSARRSLGTARTYIPATPHATTHFKSTMLPDGRVITSFHVAGIDGGVAPQASGGAAPESAGAGEMMGATGCSTQRLDFSNPVYMRAEDRGNTHRYGNAQASWVTTKLVHRETGILPNQRGRTLPFYRDRPHTTPAALSVWNPSPSTEPEPSSPPPIAPKTEVTLPAPAARLAPLFPDTAVEADVRMIMAHAGDAAPFISAWLGSASLFEREVAKKFLRDVAQKLVRANP